MSTELKLKICSLTRKKCAKKTCQFSQLSSNANRRSRIEEFSELLIFPFSRLNGTCGPVGVNNFFYFDYSWEENKFRKFVLFTVNDLQTTQSEFSSQIIKSVKFRSTAICTTKKIFVVCCVDENRQSCSSFHRFIQKNLINSSDGWTTTIDWLKAEKRARKIAKTWAFVN